MRHTAGFGYCRHTVLAQQPRQGNLSHVGAVFGSNRQQHRMLVKITARQRAVSREQHIVLLSEAQQSLLLQGKVVFHLVHFQFFTEYAPRLLQQSHREIGHADVFRPTLLFDFQ